ncbi:unnamed protein product [Lampetra planeri]
MDLALSLCALTRPEMDTRRTAMVAAWSCDGAAGISGLADSGGGEREEEREEDERKEEREEEERGSSSRAGN